MSHKFVPQSNLALGFSGKNTFWFAQGHLYKVICTRLACNLLVISTYLDSTAPFKILYKANPKAKEPAHIWIS